MRILRVIHQGRAFYASLHPDGIKCLNAQLGIEGVLPLEEVSVLPPVMPTKIVCAAVNYRSHAAEMGKTPPDEPVIFLKPPSSVIGSGQAVVIPRGVGRVDYEGELAVVIGKQGRNILPADAPAHIFGFACACDVTARDLQKKDGQFGRAKGFDTFCPIGPWIETEVQDPSNLTVRTRLNGKVVQEGSTSEMLVSPLELVSFVSRVMTLSPGDVILTGTPAGVGPISPGDEIRVEIDNVGILICPAVAEADEGPVQ